MACKFVIVFRGTGQHYLPPPLQDHPQAKGFCKNVVLQFGRSRYILLYACPVLLRSGLSLVSRSGDSAPGPKETEDAERARKAETAKQRQNIDQQECAPGSLSPTNMPIAKTLCFAIPGTKRIMQECALGEKGAIVFAEMRFVSCFNK